MIRLPPRTTLTYTLFPYKTLFRSADRLDLVLQLSGKTGETIVIPAPVVIEYDDAHFWNFEEANVVFASPEAVNPAELVDLLDNACFSSSDAREADSWDTQHDRFLLDAQTMATRLLPGDDAALHDGDRTSVCEGKMCAVRGES